MAFPLGTNDSFRHEIPTVNCAPSNKGPVCSMPQTADDHDEEQVPVHHGLRTTVSAERDVEVVTQPT
ncbi:unannotated protein [freshwater metagenome]|uniref:Unannotated protein n=1 Tax=freshwater metagenome TaxID=449393 RepID=A0A6J6FV77_9ZZZZ